MDSIDSGAHYFNLLDDNRHSTNRNTSSPQFSVVMVVVSDPGAHGPMAYFICDTAAVELGEEPRWSLTRDFLRAHRFNLKASDEQKDEWKAEWDDLDAAMARDGLVLHSYQVMIFEPSFSLPVNVDYLREKHCDEA